MVTYEPGFKEEAVKLAAEVGAVKAAQDLGVPVNTLYTWISRLKAHGERAHAGSGKRRQQSADDENAKLRKRNKELERVNQILKEALSFFVVSQKK
ncbi:MAG: transposase [Sporomusa sp.]